MTFYTTITFSEAFRDLIKHHNYEKYILSIINRSVKIFSGKTFELIQKQSNGETDFVDNCGKKYDAKLLLDTQQGQLIGEPKNSIQQWLEVMVQEKTEFAESIRRRDLTYVEKTKLYQIMKDRVASLKEDENGILFIPFPIVEDFEGGIFFQLATDFLQATYDRIKEQGHIGKRRIYFIYPSMKAHEYVLRNDNRIREFIMCPDMKDFISFETVAASK